MVVDQAGQLVSCGMDDTVRFTDTQTKEYRYYRHTNFCSRCSWVHHCTNGFTRILANNVFYFSSASDVVKMDAQPKCVSIAPGGLTLVVCIDLVSPVQSVTLNSPPSVLKSTSITLAHPYFSFFKPIIKRSVSLLLVFIVMFWFRN